MKRFIRGLILLSFLLALSAAPIAASSKGSSSGKSSKSSSSKTSKAKSSSPKTVHVKEYKRKDGTVVSAHDRAAPGTKEAAPSATPAASSTIPKSSTVATRNKNGKIARSALAKTEFMKSTGYPKGRKGYVVDHAIPLECGGVDAPSNMQWQTIAEGKAKDRTERTCRQE